MKASRPGSGALVCGQLVPPPRRSRESSRTILRAGHRPLRPQASPRSSDARQGSRTAVSRDIAWDRNAAPDPARYGPSTLIEAGGKRILVDAGRGATMRLFQLGVPIGSIDILLLTHFHSDHVVGIPDIWLTGWLGGKFGRRSRPFQVIGPPGTISLMRHLRAAYMADIEIRIADEALPEAGARDRSKRV